MPFLVPPGEKSPPVHLSQVGAKLFMLLADVRYVSADGRRAFHVTPANLGPTDLTSVPSFFRWFVSPYGRHTLSALLHDCLIDPRRATKATTQGEVPDRRQADDLFLEALGASGVPRIRRYLMWSAVTFSTRLLHSAWPVRLAMLAWVALAGFGLREIALATELEWSILPLRVKDGWRVARVLPGPVAACWLWGRSWLAGMCFGYGSVLLVLPAILCYAAYAIYWIAEYVLNLLSAGPPPPDFGKF